ncbi:MAG TPA: hypothetical protein VD884_14310 [Ohtaekwangia sp.]|nr:hypothetical protein [Ohtaekwangia sp.]
MIPSFIEKIIEKHNDVLIFKSEAKREEWISNLESIYSSHDGITVMTKKNRQTVDFKTVEEDALQRARPMLRAMSTSRYLPKFIDKRNTEQRLKASQEVEKLTDHYLEKLGIVFKNEHLGDTRARAELKNFIKTQFLYEAGGPEGELVFRKNYQGMFGPAITPSELILKYATPYLDQRRTSENQARIEKQLMLKTLEKLGYQSIEKLTGTQRAFFDNELKRSKEEELISYTQKKLPVKSKQDYREEFRLRALHKNGLVDERFGSLQEKMTIDHEVNTSMESLNNFGDFNIPNFTGSPKWSTWEGMDDTENNSGYYLTADQL